MTAHGMLRGYDILFIDGRCVFRDTMEPTVETWEQRPCGKCGLHNTPEGHDACLGTLPGVKNACCGHGNVGAAFIQYSDDRYVQGQDALEQIEKLKR